MSDAARGHQDHPFTLVVCASCQAATDRMLDELRRAVRDSPHGVMISTGCLGKILDCAGPRGLHVAVQPCTVDRSPTGAVARLGPFGTAADAAAVGAWLRAGMLDDGTLPDRLLAAPAGLTRVRP